MDKVSNAPFEQKEYDRLVKVCAAEDVKLPTKQALERKVTQITKFISQPMTEQDINIMLQRKKELQQLSQKRPTGLSTIERSRLLQAKTLAIRRQDYVEVAEIEAKLAAASTANEDGEDNGRGEEVRRKISPEAEMLARVNERNRRANMEAVRKAEVAEMERKRRERKLAAMGVGGGGGGEGGSGTASPVPVDPSARLKTKPRMFNAATPSRAGTPNAGSANGTPVVQATTVTTLAVGGVPPRPVSPLALGGSSGKQSFEASIIDSIEVDLGDF
ncbi:hypothetical protein AX16_010097 [Volvariella volvacea WC 439]|nr:hypothetical protein AX16_010097 [Volvariella volvacea WC 439]